MPPEDCEHAPSVLAMGIDSVLPYFQLLALKGACPSVGHVEGSQILPRSASGPTSLRLLHHWQAPAGAPCCHQHHSFGSRSRRGIFGVGLIYTDGVDVVFPPSQTHPAARCDLLRSPLPLQRPVLMRRSTTSLKIPSLPSRHNLGNPKRRLSRSLRLRLRHLRGSMRRGSVRRGSEPPLDHRKTLRDNPPRRCPTHGDLEWIRPLGRSNPPRRCNPLT
mmetsp:Transcript_61418/g.126830  ORF Transcript_61418/g.126830 Transcript_61418/m.126830 type:complete len:218 (-) Transcript_61418:631-1284(-)